MQDDIKIKRTVKDSVFSDLFKDKKNLLALYKTLHPEDTNIAEDMLHIGTINTVLIDDLYNDLGLFVRDDKILLLLEAQSTWTVNIVARMLLYAAQTYQEYFERTQQKLYGSKKAKMPKPELYVIYTGKKGEKPDVISLSGEFFGGEDACIEVKARVIYESDSKDIINQYIIFCKVFNRQVKKHGRTQKAVTETIRICKDKDVLGEYLAQHEREVLTIMMKLFDEEYQQELHWKDKFQRAIKKEVRKAEQATKLATEQATAARMIQKGKMTLEEISECVPSLSFNDIKKLAAEIAPAN